MRIKLILPLLTLAVLAPAAVQAQVYTWKDARGTVHYSDAPPPHGVKYTRLNIKSDGPANTPATSSDQPTEQAPQPANDGNNGKRVADTPANRKAMCTQLQNNISLLQSHQAVNTAGPDGKLHAMSKQERAQQLQRERDQYQQYCQSTTAS